MSVSHRSSLLSSLEHLFFLNEIFSSQLNRKTNKKALYTNAKRLGYNLLPIARGSNGDTKQAVLLTLLHRASGLPNSSVT